MDEPSPATRQAVLDEEHLRLLSIGYWISTGIHAFASLIGLVYLFFGVMMGVMFSNLPANAGQEAPPAGLFVGLFGGIGLGIFLLMAGWALLNAKTARNLKARRSRAFCQVVAGLNCLSIPWGTALGVLTFMTLGRASVAALFDVPPAPRPAPAPEPRPARKDDAPPPAP